MRWRALSAIIFVTFLTSSSAPSQKSARNEALKYDLSNEENSKGVVSEMKESSCPVTGKTNVHLIVKCRKTKGSWCTWPHREFLKEYGLVLPKATRLRSWALRRREEESVLARKVERGTDTFTFGDKAVNFCGNCQVEGQPQVSNGQRGRLPAWEAISGVAVA